MLQKALQSIDKWCQQWGIELNMEKTVLLGITRKKTPTAFLYSLDNNSVCKVNNFKSLDVVLTDNLHGLDIFQAFMHLRSGNFEL